MAEEAAAADLISGGRLQLGVSRGSPEIALRGAEAFGYVAPEGETAADNARRKTEIFLAAINGAAVARTDPERTGISGGLAIQPQSPGLADRIWWGSGTRATAQWAAAKGMNLQSSTLLTEDTGVPFDQLQAEQIRLYRQAWAEQGWDREPRVSVSRSVLPITEDIDRLYFGDRGEDDQIGARGVGSQGAATVGRTTRSGCSRACGPGSAGRTPGNLTRSPTSSPLTRRCSPRTQCCSPCRTSLASNTTPGSWTRSPGT